MTMQQALCVRAAMKIEKEYTNIEAEFFERFHLLEIEFQSLFAEVFEKRKKIIDGLIPVTEADVKDVPLIYTAVEQIESKLKDDAVSKGIPNFWLTVLLNCPHTNDLIKKHDIRVLKHLVNIERDVIPDGFELIFTFARNKYFSNTTLRKSYAVDYQIITDDPYIFVSDTIQWVEGKNVTLKTVKKKHKKKGGENRITRTQVPRESFFNLFSDMHDGGPGCNYELGAILREHIIPHATIIYTGEYVDDDDDYEDGVDFDEGEFYDDGSEVEY